MNIRLDKNFDLRLRFMASIKKIFISFLSLYCCYRKTIISFMKFFFCGKPFGIRIKDKKRRLNLTLNDLLLD
jgi:hypothetical protein